MAMTEYEGKKVHVSLNTNSGKRRYSGIVNEIVFMGESVDGVRIYMFTITDKFNSIVSFTNKEIEYIEEEK